LPALRIVENETRIQLLEQKNEAIRPGINLSKSCHSRQAQFAKRTR
jgi:hypothetical protein